MAFESKEIFHHHERRSSLERLTPKSVIDSHLSFQTGRPNNFVNNAMWNKEKIAAWRQNFRNKRGNGIKEVLQAEASQNYFAK